MAEQEFVHLHNHSDFSLLDGACRVDKLVNLAVEYGMEAVAITDHGNMFGAVKFYNAAKKAKIKPIIGCEVYVAPGSRKNMDKSIEKKYYHLILLAENKKGYQNLCILVSKGYLEGFYYKPRIDKEILREHSEGLIALSACLGGEVSTELNKGRYESAEKVALEYSNIMGNNNFFLELQDHGLSEQKKVNEGLMEISKNTGIPLVATNDCHFLRKDDFHAHEVLLCVQMATTLDKRKGNLSYNNQYYLKTAEEMKTLFKDVPEAIENTVRIAERINLELDQSSTYLPNFDIPEGYSLLEYFREIVFTGFEERKELLADLEKEGNLRNPLSSYEERLEREIDVIFEMNFPGYFLIVWEFIRFARERGIPVGPGRGSGVGSLVAYCMKITDVDPLQYGLLFERFLNTERVSPPDFDIDFCIRGREEVINHVRQKYGENNVAQIITFGTMGARGAVRDVGRALGIPYGEVDKTAKMIPADASTLEDALRRSADLRDAQKNNSKIAELLNISMKLEGTVRHASTHAAAVVIAPKPVVEFAPLYKMPAGEITTQYAKDEVEGIGLLKMDFLGLKTLTSIDDTLKSIEASEGTKVDLRKIPLDDEKTYEEIFVKGNTSGVFQFEGSGMRDTLIRFKPEKFEDLIALNALYRPGPLSGGYFEEFIRLKHSREKAELIFPEMEPILEETHGVVVYQEQVMKIASDIAGFSLGGADIMRRAMGKKKPEVMKSLKMEFVNGAKEKGFDGKKATKLFEMLEKFASYGFNKSHSAAYALLAFQTAYLKAHYKVHFMSSLLTSERDNTKKIMRYIMECREMGIKILPPDINKSDKYFRVVDGEIVFGLSAIKNVGAKAIDSIIEARNSKGKIESIFDFCKKVDLRLNNKRVIESLVKAGAFDAFGEFRSRLFESIDSAIDEAQQKQKDEEMGRMALFGSADGEEQQEAGNLLPDIPEWTEKELLAFEKEALGFYLTGNPMERYKDEIRDFTTADASSLADGTDGRTESVAGLISNINEKITKKGDKMAFLTLDDLSGSTEVLVFPGVYDKFRAIIVEDSPVLVKGTVDVVEKNSEAKMKAEDIRSLDSIREEEARSMVIVTSAIGIEEQSLEQLNNLLEANRGTKTVFMRLNYPGKYSVKIAFNPYIKIKPTASLVNGIRELFGYDCVKFEL